MKKTKVKLSKKTIKEKYPTKESGDEQVARLFGRVVAVVGIFMIVAISADIYHFTH